MNYSIRTYSTKMRHKSRQKVRVFANFRGTPKNFLAKKRTFTNTISTDFHYKNSIYAIKEPLFKVNQHNTHRIEELTDSEKQLSFLTKKLTLVQIALAVLPE